MAGIGEAIRVRTIVFMAASEPNIRSPFQDGFDLQLR